MGLNMQELIAKVKEMLGGNVIIDGVERPRFEWVREK